MKFVNIEFDSSKENVLSFISDNDRVNNNVRFGDDGVVPMMKVKSAEKSIKITCELIGKNRKDNGFLVGTYFKGRIVEKSEKTYLKGVILTAPVYHAILMLLIAVFIVQCFKLGGLSVVPLFIVLFDVFLFKDEFKKQGIIKRYLLRAKRRIDNKE